jgi:5-hydroxyisourate hydrolase
MRIVAHVLDGTYGKSAAGVRACLARANGQGWVTVAETETNAHGTAKDWDIWHLERGLYRIVFETDSYFAGLGAIASYPEVAAVFRTQDEYETFEVLVMLAPYSYSVFFGAGDSPEG